MGRDRLCGPLIFTESFDKHGKDFLLSLLRRSTVKQLVFVVTQVDQTYEQHLNAAKSDDEEPEPIQMRIDRERERVASSNLASTSSQGRAPRRFRCGGAG